jgi:hypothetical protein
VHAIRQDTGIRKAHERNYAMSKGHMALALLGSALFSAAVRAGSPVDSGWYAGIGVGRSHHHHDATFYYNPSQGKPVLVPAQSGRADGFIFYGGYAFSQYLALEGAAVSFGNYPRDIPEQPGRNESFGGVLVRGLIALPLGAGWSAHAKLGATTSSSAGYTAGLGMSYSLGARAALRIDWDRVRLERGSTETHNFYTAGIVYRF